MFYFNTTKGTAVNIERIWLDVLVIIGFIDYYCSVQCKTHVEPILNPSAVFMSWNQIRLKSNGLLKQEMYQTQLGERTT
jgi:hypothetical protein